MVRIDTAKVIPTHIASHMAKGMADSKQTEACPKWTGKLSLYGESQSDELLGHNLPRYQTSWFKCNGNSAAGTQQAFLVCSLLSCATDAIDHYGSDEVVRARLALRVAICPFVLCEAPLRHTHPLRSNSRLESRRRITSLQSMLQ